MCWPFFLFSFAASLLDCSLQVPTCLYHPQVVSLRLCFRFGLIGSFSCSSAISYVYILSHFKPFVKLICHQFDKYLDNLGILVYTWLNKKNTRFYIRKEYQPCG